MHTTIDKKTLPDGITKKQFFKLYSRIPEHKLRKRINLIIYDFQRNLPENIGKTKKDIINTQTIEARELLEYAKTYGFPGGYCEEI